MALILTILAVLTVLLMSETWWRLRKPHDELSRKFVHITVGSFAAFWPYYLRREEILLLSASFVVVVLVSKYAGIFKAIHAVERPTWGEICFAVAVGALALLANEPIIYTIALLHMSLADALAALVGTKYGKRNSYKIFGHTKSVAGSLAFLLCSWVILLAYGTVAPLAPPVVLLVGTALFATALENIAIKGVDNLLVPVFVATVLMSI